jgi:hypothetical protein
MTNKPEIPERERQMAEFSIGHDGLRYHTMDTGTTSGRTRSPTPG